MKLIFLFLILTFTLSQLSIFVESKQCQQNENTLTLYVKCEIYQQPLKTAYKYTKVVKSSKSYRKELNQLKISASVSGGFKGFSASASAAYESLKDSIESSETYGETINETKTEFNPDYLQIKRQVVTTLTINGRVASMTEERIVDSRPKKARMSSEELRQEAAAYMQWEFPEEKVIRNKFTKTVCTKKIEIKEELTKRETRKYQVWTDKGTGAWRDFSCWSPVGESMLASIPENGYSGNFKGYVFKGADEVLDKPRGYRRTWKDSGSGASRDVSFWVPTCNAGYVALGDYCKIGHGRPSTSAMSCIRKDLTYACGKTQIWTDKGTGAWQDAKVFKSYDPFVQGMITDGRQAYCLKM